MSNVLKTLVEGIQRVVAEQKIIEEKIRLEKTEPLAQPVRDDVYLDIFEETLQYKTKGTLWRLKSQVIEIERTGELKLNNGEVYEIGKPKRKREWYMQKTIDGNFIIFSIDMPAQNDITSLLTEVPITAVDPKEGTKLMRYVLYLETVIIFLLTALYILPPELAIYFFGFIRPETIIGYTIAIMIFFWNVYQLQKYRTALTGGFRIIDKRLEAIDLVLYDEKAKTRVKRTILAWVLHLQLYYSDKANVKEIFGWSLSDVKSVIDKELEENVQELQREKMELKLQLHMMEERINNLLKLVDEYPDYIALAYATGYDDRDAVVGMISPEEAGLTSEAVKELTGTIWKIALLIFLGMIIWTFSTKLQIVIPREALPVVYLGIIIVAIILGIFLATKIDLSELFESVTRRKRRR